MTRVLPGAIAIVLVAAFLAAGLVCPCEPGCDDCPSHGACLNCVGGIAAFVGSPLALAGLTVCGVQVSGDAAVSAPVPRPVPLPPPQA